MKVLIMADGVVGHNFVEWMIVNYPEDIAAVVRPEQDLSPEQIMSFAGECDLGMLVWWPNIIKNPLLSHPKHGFINTHPSFLPVGRGKNYNFWAIVEKAPFGVTLHMAEEEVDSGDIIVQRLIPYGWEDNGESLYYRAQEAMIKLLQDAYPMIRALDFPRKPQTMKGASFHKGYEMEEASRIDLDCVYYAHEIFNRLRARTFPGHPSCWFEENGEEYEVRINIKRRDKCKEQR